MERQKLKRRKFRDSLEHAHEVALQVQEAQLEWRRYQGMISNGNNVSFNFNKEN